MSATETFMHTDIRLLSMFVVFVRCSLACVLWIWCDDCETIDREQ